MQVDISVVVVDHQSCFFLSYTFRERITIPASYIVTSVLLSSPFPYL
jgi:hypothetical protein